VLVLPVAKLRAAIQLAEAAMSIDLNQKMKLARALRTGFSETAFSKASYFVILVWLRRVNGQSDNLQRGCLGFESLSDEREQRGSNRTDWAWSILSLAFRLHLDADSDSMMRFQIGKYDLMGL